MTESTYSSNLMFLLEEFSKVGNPNFRIPGFHDDLDDSRGRWVQVIHLPLCGYDVRSCVPINESCRFEAHVGTSNFHRGVEF